MRLGDVLRESCLVVDLKGTTREGVIREMTGVLQKEGLIGDANLAARVVLEREKLGSTGIGEGVAIPHGKMKGIDTILCSFGRSAQGINFQSVDKKPVHIFFLLLAPENAAGLHLKMLSRISRILRDPSFRKRIMEEGSVKEIYRDILGEDEKFSG
jgi:nitrogen PTS system EIIA component